MKNNFFIAVCMTITIALFFAWSQRWSDGPKQTQKDQDTDIVLQHKKDNWADQSWLVIYGVDGKVSYYGSEKPASNEKNPDQVEKTRKTLTYAWFGLTFLFLLLSIFGIINKLLPKEQKRISKPNRPLNSGAEYR